MTELLSLVVTVRPEQPVDLPGHLGRAVYAQLLRWLNEADPALAKRWHDDNGLKPFACSTLLGGRRTGEDRRQWTPDAPGWFRISSFDAAVSSALRRQLDNPPDMVELDGLALPVVQVTADSSVHPWAGSTRFSELAAPHLLARTPVARAVGLRFVSPVAFRQNDMNMPLPLPPLVFGSLADRWNAFSPVAISPEVRAFCETGVALNRFALRSRALPSKGGAVQIGAVGTAHYVATRYDRYWLAVLALLAEFAFYASVGRMTTVGLGQTQRVLREPLLASGFRHRLVKGGARKTGPDIAP